jgi:opine dehydrogenase
VAERVSVIGAGNAGYAMAADLSLAGHQVILYELPAFAENLVPVMHSGGIKTTGVGRTGFARPRAVTTDISEALAGSEFIFVATVANAHDMLAEMMGSLLRPEHTVVLFPGSGGALVLAAHFRRTGTDHSALLVETYSSPYACRKLHGPGTINIHRKYESNLPMGTFPARRTEEALHRLRPLFPQLIPFRNVLEVALYNPNILVHPVGTLLNAGRIEYTKGDFYLYREGFTESVVAFLRAIDQEKVAVLKALGLEGIGYMEMRERLNSLPFHEFAKISSKGPFSIQDRYVTEDVPNGMVMLSSLGHHLGVMTPNCDAVIQIFSAINGADYRSQGRTVERLGLSDLSRDQILRYVETGEREPQAPERAVA